MEGEEEYIDVHEGGELSWMQRVSDLVRIYGHRIEAHGDAARIVIGETSLDIGPFEGKICFQAHLELPTGSDAGAPLEDLIKKAEKVYRAVYTVRGPLRYVLDDSLGGFGLVHILKCYDSPADLVRDLEAMLKAVS